MPLTIDIIKNARPGINSKGRATTKPYKLGDSGGLYLLVHPRGGKWWRLKYRYGGKEKLISLGTYPKVSLTDARELRDEYRSLLKGGIDPGSYIQEERTAQRAEEARRIEATRFMLDNTGALSFRLGKRCLLLTPDETAELRTFLNATTDVKPCP